MSTPSHPTEPEAAEAAAKYRGLFDAFDEGFAILQLLFDEAGKARDFLFLETNRAFERLSGVALSGKRALELLPQLEPSWIELFGKVAISREPIRFESCVEATGMWFSVYASALGERADHQVAVVLDDITRRKRREATAAFLAEIQDDLARSTSADEVLRAVGARLGAFLKLDSCFCAELYPARDEARVRYIWSSLGSSPVPPPQRISEFVNDAALRLYLAGKPLVVFDTQADPRTEAEACRARRIGSFVGTPYQRKEEGVAIFAVSDLGPRDWQKDEIDLLRELSERLFQRLERADADASLRATELRLQQTLEAAGMGTFVWYAAEDRTEADERMLGLFGLPASGTLNLRVALAQLIHPEDRERYASAVARATDPLGSGSLREDIRVQHPDGSWHWLSVTARATFEAGRTARLTGMVLDVSDRRFTEDALRRSEHELKESDRRKDEFLAVLAHELRNPLAPIRTGLELLRMSGDTPEAVARVRAVMERQVSHVVRLVDDLLDVSRINSGSIRLQRQPTPLHTLVSTAVEAHRAALEAGQLQLALELPTEPITLDVDPTRFVQVLSNILHNAIKFTDPGGWIRIAAQLEAPAAEAAPRLLVTLQDSGAGIPQQLLPRIFELFTQGETASGRASGGLGIGLALARRLVEMHGGSIEAFSAGPGQGSRFTIRVPLPVVELAVQRPESAARLPAIRRRVVAIDDNADAADTIALLIEASGGECRVAYDGESGLQQVLEFRPDVVLLDIGMPGIDGYETCRRIRRACGAGLLIAALTGWGQERDKDQALRAGFDLHLTKPVNPVALRELLARAPAAAYADAL